MMFYCAVCFLLLLFLTYVLARAPELVLDQWKTGDKYLLAKVRQVLTRKTV